MTPPEVITGSTSLDRAIGFINALSGQGSGENFGLFQNWFQVQIQDLVNGYTFEDATNPVGRLPTIPRSVSSAVPTRFWAARSVTMTRCLGTVTLTS